MAWIDVIDPDDATGDLKELYDTIAEQRGKVSNVLTVHSQNPAALKEHLDLYDAVLFGASPLSRADREAIAVVVSAANECDYCVRHHAEALQAYWQDEDRVHQLADDYTKLDALDDRLRTACAVAEKLTAAPGAMAEADVHTLRDAGWSDRAVLDIVLVTSYFNFVNRITNGLGVEATEEEAAGYNY
ncbi:putative peroxidase-related enzyme [Salinibacter ruber]|uniref:peroxidase-related enzyme n=1 Tax=Salinibacter ruber TaxID=146919 RepID=UPI0021678473|nr:peroxidase-related enzyme [Salinibacter ruber]MCS3649773.1 putative peroxidase-related enzyme [Salinibacter ruber]MCS3653027.1 putative peroxidase-related enzyme [Salinibacter ruber]MCS3757849.1 putative peroxidase-related enzyme [Salinibacter ruber]MCS3954503.1 putative peroxidase-related enzyme [Salinibacter ruber]